MLLSALAHAEQQKTAGLLGPTDQDATEAAAAGALSVPAAATAASVAAPAAYLSWRMGEDAKAAPASFNNLGEFLNAARDSGAVDLPNKLDLHTRLSPGAGMFSDYGALPWLSSRIKQWLPTNWHGPEQKLYVPGMSAPPYSADVAKREGLLGSLRAHAITQGEPFEFGGGAPTQVTPEKPFWRTSKWLQEKAPILKEVAPPGTVSGMTEFSIPAVAHELGHIGNSHKLGPRGLMAAVLLGSAGAGVGTLAATQDESEFLQKAAPAVAVAPSIPLLLEEARASLNARKITNALIEQGKLDPSYRTRNLKALLPAYATYLLGSAALPAAIAATAGSEYRDRQDRSTFGDIVQRAKEVGQWSGKAMTDPREAIKDLVKTSSFLDELGAEDAAPLAAVGASGLGLGALGASFGQGYGRRRIPEVIEAMNAPNFESVPLGSSHWLEDAPRVHSAHTVDDLPLDAMRRFEGDILSAVAAGQQYAGLPKDEARRALSPSALRVREGEIPSMRGVWEGDRFPKIRLQRDDMALLMDSPAGRMTAADLSRGNLDDAAENILRSYFDNLTQDALDLKAQGISGELDWLDDPAALERNKKRLTNVVNSAVELARAHRIRGVEAQQAAGLLPTRVPFRYPVMGAALGGLAGIGGGLAADHFLS